MEHTRRQSAGKDKSLALAYITGVYLGDGCLTKRQENNSWNFRLNTVDEDFAEAVMSALETLFGRRTKMQTYKDKRFPKSKLQWQVHFGAKDLWPLKDATANKNIIPKFIKLGSDDEKREFIAGVMDSEGWICQTSWKTERNGNYWEGKRYLLGVGATEPWIDEFAGVLMSIGVQPNKRREDYPYKNAKRKKIQYLINKDSFLKAGCYFKIQRKQKRLEAYQSDLSPQRLHAQHLNR